MRWRVARATDASAWHQALQRVPATDVFFSPEYHQVYEVHGDGTAYAFIAEDGDDLLFHPFFVRPITAIAGEPITERLSDVETVRGQGGPVATTRDLDFLRRAWATYSRWCTETGVVAEFTRFHMYLDNRAYAHPDCAIIRHAQSVAVSLVGSEESLWASYPSVHRNMVRKALKHGLECHEVPWTDGIAAFTKLYEGTMRRVGAADRAYYSDAFFGALHARLGDSVRLWGVYGHGRIVAAALFLLSRDRIFYDLAASDAQHRGVAPNNLLLHTVAGWGRSNGFTSLFLGDGSGNPDLMRFKASASNDRLTQHIGRRVHDRQAFDRLSQRWLRAKGNETRLPAVAFPYRVA
jgi:CelD/BcsL family acetyltransferase involved in cellulose biosynthesis